MIRTLPLFPLPGVVLLPETLLPLHIFEDRYRAMVSDALRGDRTIGMAMWRPGGRRPCRTPRSTRSAARARSSNPRSSTTAASTSSSRPGSGSACSRRRRPDARTAWRGWRRCAPCPSPDPAAQARALSAASSLFAQLARDLELPPLPAEALSAERLASEIALRLRYSPQELQSILETDALPARFEAVTGRLFEWKARLNFLAPFRPSELDARRN